MMPVKKILLKDDAGHPLSSLTLPCRAGGAITLPEGLQVDAYEEREILFPQESREIRLMTEPPTLSLIGRWKGMRVFASTLPEDKALFAKWKLLSAMKERENAEKVPKTPLTENAPQETIPTVETSQTPPSQQEQAPSKEAQTSDLPEEEPAEYEQATPSALSRAEQLLKSGEPFALFENMMPGSRWAKIKEEEYEYLVGITEGEPPRILYGIAGILDYPPDEDRLWTFFPTDEEGEEGYYLTEAMVN